jgi:hypothetical protein
MHPVLAVILIGLAAGKYITFPILVTISIVDVLFCILLTIRAWEWDRYDVAVYFWWLALLGNSVVWITYYICTRQTWVGDFLQNHVLR